MNTGDCESHQPCKVYNRSSPAVKPLSNGRDGTDGTGDVSVICIQYSEQV